ncbi:hypothetical protein DMJ13_18190 [halophilic archaeon]|nr:hypothetical protein DMJ13_18190 [halophilic archaeon]
MLDDPSTFKPFGPARVGGQRQLLFGSATGRGAARRLLERAGRDATEKRTERFLERLNETTEEVTVEEALAIAKEIS